MELVNGKVFIYHFIFYPEKAIEYLIQRKEDEHMGIALLVLVIGAIFNLFSRIIISLNKNSIDIYLGFCGFIFILNFLGNLIIFTAIIFFIKNFSLHKEEKALYKNVNYAAIFFKLVCFSYIPLFFAPVISLFGLFLNFYDAGTYYYFLKIAIYFWIAFLQILILKKIFNLKILTSIALYILPLIGLFVFIFIKILNIGISLISIIL